MKKLIQILFIILILTGCNPKAMEYFNKNQGVAVGVVLECIASSDSYTAGIGYTFDKVAENKSMIEPFIGCGDLMVSVECDPLKKPEEDPCSNLKVWNLKKEGVKK